MENNQPKTLVVGIVVHISPENQTFFRNQIENSPYVIRLIRFESSKNKLWITGGNTP